MFKKDTSDPKGHSEPKQLILKRISEIKNNFFSTAKEDEKLVIEMTHLQVTKLLEEVGTGRCAFNLLHALVDGSLRECFVLGVMVRISQDTVEKIIKFKEE